MKEEATKLLQEIEFLFEKYSDELRSSTQPFRLRSVSSQLKNYKYNPNSKLVRESLMEHVGSLPVLATAFYPHIKDDKVDLGKALTMLAIHDIGELIEGDRNVFLKKDDGAKEREAAIKLLDPMYHKLYAEVETQSSRTAQFAKSVDKIAPDIIDYLVPAEVTFWRFKYFNKLDSADKIIQLVVKYKRPYMLWNPFTTEFHKVLMDKLEAKLKTDKNWGEL